MKERFFRSRHFWTNEAGLTGILVFLLLYFIATYPLAVFSFGRFLGLLFFTLFLISGVMSVIQQRVGRLLVGGFVLAALGLLWVDFFFPARSLDIWRTLATLLALGSLTVMVLSQVFREGAITFHRICGAIAVYLLFAWIWAEFYLLIILLAPGAIQLPPQVTAGTLNELQDHLVYFSVITLTTLGYGDITPVSPSARLLVMLEALVGQLYPAITLAWLVSMEIVSRTQKK